MLQSSPPPTTCRWSWSRIGGNDFNFADVVQTCVVDFLYSPTWWKDYCNDDSSVTANFTAANVAAVRARIATASRNVATAMRNAGYADARGPCSCRTTRRRSRAAPASATARAATPGRAPAAAASGTPTPTGPTTPRCPRSTAPSPARSPTPASPTRRTLDLASAFNGRRLCENTVGLYEEKRHRQLDQAGRGRPDRVDQPDPHRVDLLLRQPVLHPGVAAPELLGPAGHPLLRAAGLERRHHPRGALPIAGTGLVERRAARMSLG